MPQLTHLYRRMTLKVSGMHFGAFAQVELLIRQWQAAEATETEQSTDIKYYTHSAARSTFSLKYHISCLDTF